MNDKDDHTDEQVASPTCPVYQVYTCGPFLVKRWDGASYHAVPVGAWGGSHFPRLLLKVLLCSPGRQTSRGRLLETLWPDIDPEESGRYLNDAAYRLRKVLQSPMGAESLLLTQDSHSYRLPSQEVVWVDADEAFTLLQRAEEIERGGGDPLPLVEEATGYLSRGEFLAEEEHLSFYGRRATVARARRGGLLAQARIYQQRGWLRRGEALLSRLVEENPLDEDALCALMLNLHQQRRTSEGLRLYEETRTLLEREGLISTETTRVTEQRLRSGLPTVEEPRSTFSLTRGTPEKQVVLIHNDHTARSAVEPSLSTALRRPDVGTCFVLSALYLAEMGEDGGSLDPLFESLRIVLRGVQAMPIISRRQILQFGASALVPGIPIPAANHLTEAERVQLHQALGESIAAGWTLFHSAENAHVLAIGQAQYFLIQYVSTEISPSARPMLYSGVHRLIGAALHFQGRYEEAYRAHEQAYITALEGGDAWNMAQSRSWQAYGLQALGRHSDALVIADGALRLISQQDTLENVRLRARLLAFSANNAALLGNGEEVQRRLSASEDLLDRLPGPHEEFDRTAWLQEAGICAMSLGQYQVAASRLQQALDGFPAHWALRSIETAVPLARTLTRMNDLDGALAIAQKTLPIVRTAQSHVLTQKFIHCLHADLLTRFSRDDRCRAFIAQAERQLLSA